MLGQHQRLDGPGRSAAQSGIHLVEIPLDGCQEIVYGRHHLRLALFVSHQHTCQRSDFNGPILVAGRFQPAVAIRRIE